MAEHEQSSSGELADLLDLNLLSEAQLDDVVGGAHTLGQIITASKGWYDQYRKDGKSKKDALKSVYEDNLSADDKVVIRPFLELGGVDIE
ncbi:hypothetical protein [Noviherbaspirillum soli]|uniref:hypothetical protein n=1 Tax=Noviherbaspirillum soli TaxID=1064518 RepID=UPI00188D2B36|nr:hypothetical protein [Noviherbaspirillum soli]